MPKPGCPLRLNVNQPTTTHFLLRQNASLRSPPQLKTPSNFKPQSSSSSSDIPPRHLPPQPRTPFPWIWRCHLCRMVYRLGTTRRCLNDGHYFCTAPGSPPSRPPCFSEQPSSDKHPIGPPLAATQQYKSRRVRRNCASEFDYPGWEVWNRWRCDCTAAAAYPEHLKGDKDCWHDCDSPSECLALLAVAAATYRSSVLPSRRLRT
jgi:hypothetical protein